jgi:hypothetical protein
MVSIDMPFIERPGIVSVPTLKTHRVLSLPDPNAAFGIVSGDQFPATLASSPWTGATCPIIAQLELKHLLLDHYVSDQFRYRY